MEKLLTLLTIPGPTGDEQAVADWMANELREIPGVALQRLGDNLLAVRGSPRTAIFAHLDTTGFTLGYRRQLIPIGAPDPQDKDELISAEGLRGRLRATAGDHRHAQLRRVRDAEGAKAKPVPGARGVYARKPKIKGGVITAPYLDNRAGCWAALETLRRCENAAAAFTTGEERHGHGARVCADWLYRQRGIAQAIISDLTWHTADTPCGKGPAISLRDAFSPRQAFLDRVLKHAEASGVVHQREIQSAGSSDGAHILRSSVPMDWVFIGAPEKYPHTSHERATMSDLQRMIDLLTEVVARLHQDD
ncbi:MAG TPA: M20/M25/M40 family metallo-hydrolase [Pirellulales bacterium]|nr:M20/M25/M40 family metallo-hydrolase [Pirellulales bacterium]